MAKSYKTLGVMIDMSRNAVMSMEGLKRFLTLLRKMGYNMVMLYTEDTYEVVDEPYFGYMRGRYSIEEMKEIDAFCTEIGMTAIPCIQTLAHLNGIFKWGKYPRDTDDILLVDDERNYMLIDNMFKTLSECFSSRLIHIGMDEAHNLGRGRHLDMHGYEKVTSIMKRHLERIVEIAKKYDYELMVWSDMFFRSWNRGTYRVPRCEIPKDVLESLPPSVIPVYWDYYQSEEEKYLEMIDNHKPFPRETWFAGGAWSWQGMIPFNKFTLDAMIPALDACKKRKVQNIFFTMWGDDGAECSHFSQLPSLFYLAEYAKGNKDEAKIKKKFKSLIGIDYDDFMKIDIPNELSPYAKRVHNPSKYLLFSDYFNGFLDYTVKEGWGAKFGEFAKELKEIGKKSRKYGYVFDAAVKLCEALEIKAELGVKTRKAYQENDKKALEALAKNEYVEVEKRIRRYALAFEKQWFTDNKPHGFDVQDHRLGALLQRTDACRRRLLAYVSGKIDKIDELEEELLPFRTKDGTTSFNNALKNSTVNLSYHCMLP